MAVTDSGSQWRSDRADGAGLPGNGMPSILDTLLAGSRGRDLESWLRAGFDLAVDAAAVLVLMIATTAVVSLPTKLAGGAPIPWAGAVWLGVLVIGIALAALRPLRTLQAGLMVVPFLALTGWVWLSYGWTDSPYDTLRGIVFLTGSHIAAVALAARYSWKKLMQLTAVALTILMIVSVLLALGLPRIGRMAEIHVGAWSGVFMEKQALGFFAVHLIMLGAALALYGGRNVLWLLVIPLGLVAIVGATGRSAMLMVGLGLAVIVWGWLVQQGPRLAIATTWSGLVGALLVAGGVYYGTDEILRLLGRSSDITGRKELWEALEMLSRLDPWRGLGYQGFWRGEEVMTSPYQWIMDYTGFTPANAHSSWLDAQVQLGLVGLGLLVVCVGLTWVLAFVRLRTGGPGEVFALATLAALTLISFTETTFLNPIDLQWMLVLMFAVKLLQGEEVPARRPLASPAADQLAGRLAGSTWTFAPPPS